MNNLGIVIKEIDDILIRFDELDLLCESNNIKAEFILLGGAALLIHLKSAGCDCRPTRDIDVNVLSANTEEIYDKLNQLQIDIVGGVMELPPMEDFEGNKYEVDSCNFTAIRLFVPTIELLACTKIFTKREKDLKDLEETNILKLCDKDVLKEMINEYKEYLINPTDPDLNLHKIMNLL